MLTMLGMMVNRLGKGGGDVSLPNVHKNLHFDNE